MRLLSRIALAGVAAMVCGCGIETPSGGIRSHEIEYPEPGPDFYRAREKAARKAQTQEAQHAESAPKDVQTPEHSDMTSE